MRALCILFFTIQILSGYTSEGLKTDLDITGKWVMCSIQYKDRTMSFNGCPVFEFYQSDGIYQTAETTPFKYKINGDKVSFEWAEPNEGIGKGKVNEFHISLHIKDKSIKLILQDTDTSTKYILSRQK